MFRITEDPSSGRLVQCLAKITRISVDMDKVGVMAAYVVHCIGRVPSYTVHYTHAHTTCCHNTDLVRVNGHDRTVLVIFS